MIRNKFYLVFHIMLETVCMLSYYCISNKPVLWLKIYEFNMHINLKRMALQKTLFQCCINILLPLSHTNQAFINNMTDI